MKNLSMSATRWSNKARSAGRGLLKWGLMKRKAQEIELKRKMFLFDEKQYLQLLYEYS